MNEKLETAIRENYVNLRKSEKKVADFLICSMGSFRELTLEKLANEAGVSQPTVLRFLRSIGYQGFKEFRYVLADEQEKSRSDYFLYGCQITEKDSLFVVPDKIIATSIEHLKETRKSVSPVYLEKAIEMICKAKRIAIYSVENSACVAEDLATKLMYLGINCCVYSDYYMQHVSANNLMQGDLAIGISYSGSAKSTVDAMRLAQEAGAATIVITNFEKSKIRDYADVVLATSNEQYIYGNKIFSRISQLAVVDMIYSGILLSDYSRYTKILDGNSQIVGSQSYTGDEID